MQIYCLILKKIQQHENDHHPVDAHFLDGAAVVQMLNPETVKTFLEYTVLVFRHICIWKSLLALTLLTLGLQTDRHKKGKGVRIPVVLSALILKNWTDFLYVWTRTRQNCWRLVISGHPFTKRGQTVYEADCHNMLCALT